jgi:hypothetical protein
VEERLQVVFPPSGGAQSLFYVVLTHRGAVPHYRRYTPPHTPCLSLSRCILLSPFSLARARSCVKDTFFTCDKLNLNLNPNPKPYTLHTAYQSGIGMCCRSRRFQTLALMACLTSHEVPHPCTQKQTAPRDKIFVPYKHLLRLSAISQHVQCACMYMHICMFLLVCVCMWECVGGWVCVCVCVCVCVPT